MKLEIKENENGEGFLSVEQEEGDPPDEFEEITELLASNNLVFSVEDRKLIIYDLPNNIDLGYN